MLINTNEQLRQRRQLIKQAKGANEVANSIDIHYLKPGYYKLLIIKT